MKVMQLRMYPMLELISSGQSLEIVRAKCRQRENWKQEPVPKCDNFGQHWAMMNPLSRNHTFSESSGEVELMFYLCFIIFQRQSIGF